MLIDPAEILRAGVEQGLHLGAQLTILQNGEEVLHFSVGEARPGVPMETQCLTQWFSSGKPLTVVALAQLLESKLLRFGDPVARFIPEFGKDGKEGITLKHLLTHTAGLRAADKLPPDLAWPEMIERICNSPLEEDWMPGEKAAYSPSASWYLLAEIVQRIVAQPFDLYLKEHWLGPLKMNDSWLRLPLDEHQAYGQRIALLYDTSRGKPVPLPLQDAQGMAQCRPGSSARGPVHELARFYQMLLEDGAVEGEQLLKPETVHYLRSRQRMGLYDHTFLHTLDFGLGFVLNSNQYGLETVPYGYGRHASPGAFGHSGAQTSCAFADPQYHLAVAWCCNGLPGERSHQARQRELNSAIYKYLGLA